MSAISDLATLMERARLCVSQVAAAAGGRLLSPRGLDRDRDTSPVISFFFSLSGAHGS